MSCYSPVQSSWKAQSQPAPFPDFRTSYVPQGAAQVEFCAVWNSDAVDCVWLGNGVQWNPNLTHSNPSGRSMTAPQPVLSPISILPRPPDCASLRARKCSATASQMFSFLFYLLGAFAKLQKTAIDFFVSVLPSASPSAWNDSAPTGRILIKFDIWVFFENIWSKFKFH
jgi:hypothetical protein